MKSAAQHVVGLTTMTAGAFLLLHLLVRFDDPLCAWGVHFLRFLPAWCSIVFLLAGLVILFPPTRNALLARYVSIEPHLNLWTVDRRRYFRRGLLLLGGLLLFVLLRSAIHLLGDGYLYLRELPVGHAVGQWRDSNEPLSLRIVAGLYGLTRGWGWSPEAVYRLFSYICGGLFLLLAVPVAGEIGRDVRERLFILGFLLSAGLVQLFCGYVETYAILMPFALLFILVSLQVLKGRCPIVAAALLLGLGVTLHFSLVTLLPSLIVLALLRSRPAVRRREDESDPASDKTASPAILFAARSAWPKRLLALAAMPAMTAALLVLQGVDVREYLDSLRASHVLPLWQAPNFYQAYRLVSLGHFWDFFNQAMLVAPAAIVGLVLIRRRPGRPDPMQTFLATAFAFPVLFVFLFNPEIGAFRDWDLLSLPAVPLTIWVSARLAGQLQGKAALLHVCLMIVGAAALHTLLWVGINASATAAEGRFTHVLESGRLSVHARAYGWETLGSYYANVRSDPRRALAAFERAIAVDNDNPRYWNLAGVKHHQLGRHEKAIEFLRRAIELQPDKWPENYNNLAASYSAVGDHESAVRCLAKAVELNPDYTDGHHNLGLEQARLSRFSDAAASFERAIKLQPQFWEAWCDLARARMELGQTDEAVRNLERVISQEPAYVPAYDLLGLIYFRASDPERAIAVWQRAIQLNPRSVEIYANLAGACNALGRREEERRYLRRILEIQPDHPQAAAIRQMLQSPSR